jgi:hypothetical protein
MNNVISLLPFLVQKPKSNYGALIYCPKCGNYDFFAFASKQHIDGRIYLTAAVCLSDECDGTTVVEFKDGVVV